MLFVIKRASRDFAGVEGSLQAAATFHFANGAASEVPVDVIDISSVDDLMALIEEAGDVVIGTTFGRYEVNGVDIAHQITIYDDYLE